MILHSLPSGQKHWYSSYPVSAELAACGVGIHHAGMAIEDRRATEDLYIKKVLRIVFATSVCL